MQPHAIETLFVNSGILGQKTFAGFIDHAFAAERDGIRATQTILTEGLTPSERVLRRLLCMRLWPAGARQWRNVDLFRFRAEINAGLVARRRINSLERAGRRFDVLHFHHQATAYASIARIRRTPTIISIDCTQRCVRQAARTRLEAQTYGLNAYRDGLIFRAAREIISPSQWAAQSVRTEYPDCPTKITVMPYPVLLDDFDPLWAHERNARSRQVAGYKPRVLFVGGDFPRKGGYDLLDAWRGGQFGERASLDVVTDWPVDPASLPVGVTRHAGVAAYSAAWRQLWRDADVFVLPTRDEAFGIVYQEAAAAGLPAIGTNINAVPELIADGVSGLLVPVADRVALQRALDTLIGSTERRRDMGTAARRRIVASADPEHYAVRLSEVIRRVAEGR